MNRTLRLPILVIMVAGVVAISWALAQSSPADATIALAKTAMYNYAKAINERNHESIAAAWAENAEHIGDDGVKTEGRAAIAAMFKKTLADNPKLTVKLTVVSVKKIGGEVLAVDGRAEITNGEDKDTSPFESLWVKAGDRWELSRVREMAPVPAGGDSNYDRLIEFEWLVGDWSATQGDYTISLNAKWGRNKNFLLLEKTVKSGGQDVITVTRIVGWDPANAALRVWNFDSDGGFGGSLITRAGNTWHEDVESLTRNGGESTSKQATKYINADTFEWTATDRTLDEAPLPDLKLQFTRVK